MLSCSAQERSIEGADDGWLIHLPGCIADPQQGLVVRVAERRPFVRYGVCMKWKIWSFVLLLLAGGLTYTNYERNAQNPALQSDGAAEIMAAYRQQRSRVWVEFQAEVIRQLADDNQGSRHQRFIVQLANQHSLLISHNIDLAPRIPLQTSARLEIRGRYEWNRKGGVVHWTHHDPDGDTAGGWIRYNGRVFR